MNLKPHESVAAHRLHEGASCDGFPPALLAASKEGLRALPETIAAAISALPPRWDGPLPAGDARQILAEAAAPLGAETLPERGLGPAAAVALLAQVLMRHGLDLTHAHSVAHLQPPALSVAVAADAFANASNGSVDTFDSGPSAIAIERWVIGALRRLAGLESKAAGVLTPGGSISNLLGLLLARDAAAFRRGVDTRRQGVSALPSPVVFCSDVAHFSLRRACAALGLGEEALCAVPTDEHFRMQPAALARRLRALGPARTPIAIVATAGTTDFGTVDPLFDIADIAAAHGVWLHVDAAYGFGVLFSEHLSRQLRGIERADSITLDLHKLGWQPAAASALLVGDASAFRSLELKVPYLNPCDDVEAGYGGLLGHSLQTTRRPDAVKIAASLLAYGRSGLGRMVDACHELARHATTRIAATPELELISGAQMTTVVFRYRGPNRDILECPAQLAEDNQVNGLLRRRLLERGEALIGRTTVSGQAGERVCLKLTLLNPTTTTAAIDGLLQAVVQAGASCAAQISGPTLEIAQRPATKVASRSAQ